MIFETFSAKRATVRRRGGRHDADYAHSSLKHGVSNLQKDELSVDVASSGEVVAANKAENATLRELLSRNGNETAANTSYALTERMSNATAFSVAEERSDEELEFSNVLSLIIGLFVVLLPVVVTVSMACALRYLYVKYRLSASDSEDNIEAQRANGSAGKGGEKGESTPKSSSPTRIREQNEENAQIENNSNECENSQKPSINSSPNFVDESDKDAHIQCTGSKEAKSETPIETFNSVQEQHKSNPNIVSNSNDNSNQSAQHSSTLKSNHTGPNGSVTKMTLKNNHLIIETEERNDISRDARETKMHYNTSDKDGAFVVEVARGVDSKSVPDSPVADSKLDDFAAKEITNAVLIAEDEKLLMTQEEVQIHQPPPEAATACPAEELQRSLHQIEEVEEPTPSHNCAVDATALREETQLAQNSNTGLSQSDLSSSSSTDSNKRYSYGNQELYIIDQPGYATTSPTAHMPLATATAMPDETSDDDRKPENGHSLEHSPAQANDSVQNTETPCKLSKASAEHQMPKSADECQFNGHVEPCAQTTNDGDTGAIIEKSAEEKGVQLQKDAVLVASEAVSNTITAATLNDTDAQTEADSVADVAQTASDTITNGKHDHSGSHDNMTHVVNDETEAENAFDSIISLPAPPSTDEIKQLNDYSPIDTNQLDSLPPPPPPLLAGASEEDQCGSAEELKSQDTVAQAKGKLQAAPLATAGQPKQAPPMQINGDSDKCNGHEVATYMSILPPPPPTPPSPLPATTHVQMANNGKMLPAPLTPPASPPPSPPAHFGNAVHGGMSCVPLPVAVDVNGS